MLGRSRRRSSFSGLGIESLNLVLLTLTGPRGAKLWGGLPGGDDGGVRDKRRPSRLLRSESSSCPIPVVRRVRNLAAIWKCTNAGVHVIWVGSAQVAYLRLRRCLSRKHREGRRVHMWSPCNCKVAQAMSSICHGQDYRVSGVIIWQCGRDGVSQGHGGS